MFSRRGEPRAESPRGKNRDNERIASQQRNERYYPRALFFREYLSPRRTLYYIIFILFPVLIIV